MQAKRRETVQSFDRAVAILDVFATERSEMGVSEVARLTGLSRSTVHRLLTSLQRHEFVQQLPNSKNYVLGPHVLRLAHAAFAQVNLQSVARPVMAWLRDRSDETVGLHVAQGETARVVLDQAESRQPLRRTYTEIGQSIPIHQGAPGKVLLAYRSPEIREKILSGKLKAATPRTITDPEKLRLELHRVLRNGYALSLEERVPGTSGLAVPIRNHTDSVIATLTVTGPSTRLNRKRLQTLVPLATEAADKVSASLGYVKEAFV
jgi:IclR family acetate operon transcriptional repressor